MQKSVQDEIIQTILKSGIKAFENYYEMTEEDCWVYHTPEYWYTTNIAIGLRKRFRKRFSVFLEESVTDFRSGAVKGRGGRPSKNYRSSGRSDITLWKYWVGKDDWEAKSLIEVKRAWSWGKDTLGKDLDRLCATLLETGRKLKGGSVDCAFLTIVTDANGDDRSAAKAKIKKTHSNLDKKVNTYVGKKHSNLVAESSIKFSSFYEDASSLAAVIVFRIFIDGRRKRS